MSTALPTTHTLSLGEATAVLGKMNLTLLLRGKLWWIATGCALLPVVAALTVRGNSNAAAIAETSVTLLSIFAPLLVAGGVGEDVEKKTYAYLWARPLPRGAFVFGKLLAYVPFLMAIFIAGAALASAASASRGAPAVDVPRLMLGIGMAAMLFSWVSALIATITPKHATGVAMFYLLFVDGVLGGIPTGIRYASMQYQARSVMQIHDHGIISTTGSLGTSLTVGAIFLAVCVYVTLRRSRRLE